MIGADADPTGILPDVVDAIGRVFLLGKIMHLNGFGLTFRPPFAASILVVPYLFFLLRVY